MIHWNQEASLFRNRKMRRERVLRKMELMRSAKARKRLENPPMEPEPKMVRTTCLEIGFRDKITGHAEWVELSSARQARRIANVMLKFYQPGLPQN